MKAVIKFLALGQVQRFSRPFGVCGFLAAFLVSLFSQTFVAAQGFGSELFVRDRYAAVVINASTGEVFYARQADEPRYPASLTKILTLYLAFEALATGRLSLSDSVVISPHAAAQAPSKLGIRPGQSLSVDSALKAIAVVSANDVAVAVAEKLGGSEAKFAELMTHRARELGMLRSHFANASGLPDPQQISTARDIAILARAVLRDYPQYYSYFGVKDFIWAGHQTLNHNHLLGRVSGVDGFKTGYTKASGFHLVASATKGGKRLIAVVLGGASIATRDENVEDLLNGGFEVLAKRSQGQNLSLASLLHEPEDIAKGPVVRPPSDMGSADQQGLQVLLNKEGSANSSFAAPVLPTLTTLPPSLAFGRTAPAAIPPGPLPTKGSVLIAEAAPCQIKRHSHNHHATHSKGCAPQGFAQTRNNNPVYEGKSKAYKISFGTFQTSHKAQAKLSDIDKRFHDISASRKAIEKVGKGKYCLRLGGLSRQDAKHICHSLAARGTTCSIGPEG